MATDAPKKAQTVVEEAEPTGAVLELPEGQTITLSGSLLMKDLRIWSKAEREGDLETCYKYLKRIIVDWSFPISLKQELCFDELGIADYRDVNAAVNEWIKETSRRKN